MRGKGIMRFAAAFSLLMSPVFAGDLTDGVADSMDNLNNWTTVQDLGSNVVLNAGAGQPPGCVEFQADGAQSKLLTANGTTSGDNIEIECDYYLNEGAPGSFGASGIIFGLQTGTARPYGYMIVYDYRNQQFIAQLYDGWVPISDNSMTAPFSIADQTWRHWKVGLNYTDRKASLWVDDQLVTHFPAFDFSNFPTPPPDWEENGPVGVYSRHDGQSYFDNFKWSTAAPPPPPPPPPPPLAAAEGWEAYE